MRKLCAILLIMTLFMEGCWDQKIYEKTGFILLVGIEASSNPDNLFITYSSPVVEAKAEEDVEIVYSKEENLLREFREDSRKISSKLLEGGKIQQILISDSLAAKGIGNLLEIFEREPTNPSIAYIIISEGSPNEMMLKSKTFGDKPRSGFYTHQLIQNNIQQSFAPETQVFQFTSQYLSPGLDPIAPLVKLQFDKGKGIEVTGSALFSDDRMVGKINTWQTSLLLTMMGKLRSSVFVDKSLYDPGYKNGKRGCAFTIDKAKRKLKVHMIENKPAADIFLKLSGSIGELYWNGVSDIRNQESLEKLLAEDIKQNCQQVIKYTQEVGCDSLGIGDYVRAKYNSYWESVDWDKIYPFVKFNINVSVNITNHGVIH